MKKNLQRTLSLKPWIGEKVDKEYKLMYRQTHGSFFSRTIAFLQRYSIPLLVGVVLAVAHANLNLASYEWWSGSGDHSAGHGDDDEHVHNPDQLVLIPYLTLNGHACTMVVLINDIFMVFFFGIAGKEVTEALLPGGSLSPITNAYSPLLATLGGIIGPVVTYVIFIYYFFGQGSFDYMQCDTTDLAGDDYNSTNLANDDYSHEHEEGWTGTHDDSIDCQEVTLGALLYGWGVPTATDISLAWMVSIMVFGLGHKAIDFLLLLAVVDDGIGLCIIAIFYPDPENPVDARYLPLIPLGMALAYLLRQRGCMSWQPYVIVGGVTSWFGFLLAHVHPALALVPIVPFMPHEEINSNDALAREQESRERSWTEDLDNSDDDDQGANHEHVHPPLHKFETDLKLFVDFGMFFFAYTNAGVVFSQLGGMTISILGALVIGKTLGIAGFAIVGEWCGVKIPCGISKSALFMIGFIASMGLTVALFVAGEAFVDLRLQEQAKMGALLSAGSGIIAIIISKFVNFRDVVTDGGISEGNSMNDKMKDEADDEVVVNVLQSAHPEPSATPSSTKVIA